MNHPYLKVEIKKHLKDRSGNFDLDIRFDVAGGITILFGPSGSGKSTTLRAIAGIIVPDEGSITVGDRVFFDSSSGANISIQKRRVGYVFQDYALFPHLTAEQNVSFGIKEQTERQRRERAREMLTLFNLDHIGQRYPGKMSGGEQQRIALARALASDPSVVLLDEPLSAVDLATRISLLDEIEAVQSKFAIPFIYVTHNTEEANRLGTNLVVLESGGVKQTGPAREIFKSLGEAAKP